jgi:regulatory protein
LSDHDVAALCRRDVAARAVNVASAYLARRPRSVSEVRNHLIDRSFSPDEAAQACSRLASLGYLDDAAFAMWWVGNRTEHRPRGRLALRYELTARGVPRALVEAALATVEEAPAATGLATRQAPRYRHLGRYEFNQRVGAYLERRGFAMEAIRAALDDAWAHITER